VKTQSKVVLLGPQVNKPTLPHVMELFGISGPVATVTAGWQERETDDADLRTALAGRGDNLRLWQRTEDVFAADPELQKSWRRRQERLRVMQDCYRIRLDFALDAVDAIERKGAPPEEIEAAIESVRWLDGEHLRRCQAVHAEHDEAENPAARPAVAKQRKELEAILARSAALCIAGGHVATLLNRLKLFAIRHEVVFAWSAGAMAVTERVVLYHDSPPQGAGHAEVLDAGLGFCPGVVALPSPRLRLRADDTRRVSLYARRFAPDTCLAFDDGTWAAFPGRRAGVTELHADGTIS
jgi:hypothetical protein